MSFHISDELELIFALFTDNVWYRAKIIKKHSNTEFRVSWIWYSIIKLDVDAAIKL